MEKFYNISMYRYIEVFEAKLKIILVSFFVVVFGVLAMAAPEKIIAFSLSISGVDNPVITSKEQEVLVTLSITDLPSGDSYFRVGWDNGTSYIGYIKNSNGDWVKLGTLTADKDIQGCFNYYKVSTSVSSLALTVKIGSDQDLSNGTADLKAHRFTSTCGSNSASNLFPMTITLPTPTPTPTPSSTVTPTPTPTPTPTSSPTPVPTPTKSPTPKPTVKSSTAPQVLGEEATPPDNAAPTDVQNLRNSLKTPDTKTASQSGKLKISPLAFIFVGVGILLIGTSAFFLVRNYRKEYTESGDEKVS